MAFGYELALESVSVERCWHQLLAYLSTTHVLPPSGIREYDVSDTRGMSVTWSTNVSPISRRKVNDPSAGKSGPDSDTVGKNDKEAMSRNCSAYWKVSSRGIRPSIKAAVNCIEVKGLRLRIVEFDPCIFRCLTCPLF